MKKTLFTLAIGILLFSACTGAKTVATGLESEAFLVLIGEAKKYSGEVEVAVDDQVNFKAEVVKDYTKRPGGKVYAISTGRHTVTVSYQNNVIFRKQIFVSAQETKKIILP